MKKLLFISLAIVLALSVGLIGCEGEQEEEPELPPEPTKIVIGRSQSETGANADIHWSAGFPIMTLFEQTVNNVSGGIHLKEYDEAGDECWVPIEFKTYDDASDPGNAVLNTVKLITEDEVDFLWGGTGTAMIHAQAFTADSYEMVLMTLEGGATDIKNYYIEDLPYLFVNLSFSDWYEIPVLADLLLEAHENKYGEGEKPSVFVAYIEDQHGLEYKGVAETEFAGCDIETFSMEYEFEEFQSVLDAAEGYDIFCCFSYPVHNSPIMKLIEASGSFNPEAIIFGPGANFGFFPYFIGADLVDPASINGVLCFAVANRATSSEFEELFDNIEAIMDDWSTVVFGSPIGFMFLDWWGHPLYWAMCQIFVQAVEEVGYIDQDELRDVLASKDETDPFDTILGDTWYTMFGDGGGILAYECHPGEIGQWQNLQVEVVGGTTTTASLNYSCAGNWTWLP